MDRLEYVRTKVDRIIEQLPMENQKYATIHLYGVSQCAIMLALHLKIDQELCGISGMLHDIAYYLDGNRKDHALHSSEYSKKLLSDSELFNEKEIELICHAILVHSDKLIKGNPYDEVLKDSDVLQHYLYNPKLDIPEKDQVRLYYLIEYIQNANRK
ncbi:MAG: HD domain-containing protein [Erysipelotrichaceae bacterium]